MACGRHVESVDVRAHAVHGIDPRAIRAFLRQREVEEELAHLPRRPDIAQVLREPVEDPACLSWRKSLCSENVGLLAWRDATLSGVMYCQCRMTRA